MLNGHADWYDDFARAALGAARAALADLLPNGDGLAVEIGCGTGLNPEVLRDSSYRPIGVDVSSDQLRLARSRLPVLRADGHAAPTGLRPPSEGEPGSSVD